MTEPQPGGAGSLSRPHTAASAAARLPDAQRSGQCSADLAQDDADALLALHLAESPVPRDAPQDADGATLPPSHPIHQLVREAAWLAAHLPLAA